eukprot:TRINITY_DN84441_c0_g1_i1.p1 TRINITY_DN84441_c0_g1~~TRINITY_DN84441_c0_g1_i1.p1  ORF type:complete len:461 (-),score=52.18 TRINITY_DN84441_c0_g1_i1:345-1679(-)
MSSLAAKVTHVKQFTMTGMTIIDRTFKVPLDYSNQEGKWIKVFAREVRPTEHKDNSQLPFLVYLQGGPGFPAPRPLSRSGWIKRALEGMYRLLLLDQRGTGQSSPLNHQTLAPLLNNTEEAAAYVSHFRADNIVRDCEAIRSALVGSIRWSLLGQSFGGFCSLTYLSQAPEGLWEVFFTGGIPPAKRQADETYRSLFKRVRKQNADLFKKYPEDQAVCNKIAQYITDNEVLFENGERFTVEQFQLLGFSLGAKEGPDKIHYMLDQAFVDVNGEADALSMNFLHEVYSWNVRLEMAPIYTFLHEAIYVQSGQASNWAASRVLHEKEQEDFVWKSGKDFMFTGEMVFPWMFDQMKALKPLKPLAEKLAAKDNWSDLYNFKKLENNTVPCAAIVYYNDMYVDREFSMEVAESMPNCHAWVTSEYCHDGIHHDGEHILDKLVKAVRGL